MGKIVVNKIVSNMVIFIELYVYWGEIGFIRRKEVWVDGKCVLFWMCS